MTFSRALLGLCVCALALSSVLADRPCAQHTDCDQGEICQFSYNCENEGDCERAHGLCFPSGVKAEFLEDDSGEETALLQVGEQMTAKSRSASRMGNGGMNVTSLTVNAPPGQAATIVMGEGDSVYKMEVKPEGDFGIVQGGQDLLLVDRRGNVAVKTHNIEVGALSIGGNFIIEGMKQWRLVYHEDFSKEPITGWSNISVSECGGLAILGGYCKFSIGEVTKSYTNLTEHTQLRIKAVYHFIDAWEGETGYLKVDNGRDNRMEYVWTERYDQTQSVNAINICGNHHSEGKFSSAIDLTIPHTDEEVTLAFGSTLDQDPCDESFGVSAVQIYLR